MENGTQGTKGCTLDANEWSISRPEPLDYPLQSSYFQAIPIDGRTEVNGSTEDIRISVQLAQASGYQAGGWSIGDPTGIDQQSIPGVAR